MVSNAALRSREMTTVDLPESEERRILLCVCLLIGLGLPYLHEAVQKVSSLTQKTTTCVNKKLSVFDIVSCN